MQYLHKKQAIKAGLSKSIKEFNELEEINVKNEEHMKCIEKLFPKFLVEQSHISDWEMFKKMCRYDPKNNALAVGCFSDISTSFKLSKLIGGYKLIFTDDVKEHTPETSSDTLFTNIRRNEETIYGIIGHQDSLTAVLLDLNFIMIPSKQFELQETDKISREISGRKIVFLAGDEEAFTCMMKVAGRFQSSASEIHLKEFNSFSLEARSLNDYLNDFETIEEVKDALHNL